MDRTIAVFENKKYKAYVIGVDDKISKVELFSQRKGEGFSLLESAYDKYLYVREVKEEDVTKLYREYFMAEYKDHDFFVSTDNKINREIQILTVDSNIGRECDLDWKDRDLFTKWLGEDEEYKLFYVREYYLEEKTTKKEVTVNECFKIYNQEFE
jgi:hypothetical protein